MIEGITWMQQELPLYSFTLTDQNGNKYHKDVLAQNDETAIATITWYIGKTFFPSDTVTFTWVIVK